MNLWMQHKQQDLQRQVRQQQQTLQNLQPQLQQQQQTLQNLQQQSQQQRQALQNVQQQLNTLQQQTQQYFQQLIRQNQQESQRSMNRARKISEEPIEMLVRVDDGQMPAQQDPAIWFPTEQNDLMNATGNQFSDLLAFYGLDPDGTMTDKQNRLKRFLGVTL
jgi:exonuclease VII large subunit